MRYYFIGEEHRLVIDVAAFNEVAGSGSFEALVENKKVQVKYKKIANELFVSTNGGAWKMVPWVEGVEKFYFHEKVYTTHRGYIPSGAGQSDGGALVTQMPGKVVKILVKVGDVVEKGKPVLILEAMKMENEIKANVSGVVKSVFISEGQALETGVPMLEIEEKK